MSDCNVCFDWTGCCDEPWYEWEKTDEALSDTDGKCYECDDVIPAGHLHERIEAVEQAGEDSEIFTTCEACRDIRDALNCSSTIIVGFLWAEVEELLPELTMACVGKVKSQAGREKLLAYWRKWKGLDSTMSTARDEALRSPASATPGPHDPSSGGAKPE